MQDDVDGTHAFTEPPLLFIGRNLRQYVKRAFANAFHISGELFTVSNLHVDPFLIRLTPACTFLRIGSGAYFFL
jgi:hypothetical protein